MTVKDDFTSQTSRCVAKRMLARAADDGCDTTHYGPLNAVVRRSARSLADSHECETSSAMG